MQLFFRFFREADMAPFPHPASAATWRAGPPGSPSGEAFAKPLIARPEQRRLVAREEGGDMKHLVSGLFLAALSLFGAASPAAAETREIIVAGGKLHDGSQAPGAAL